MTAGKRRGERGRGGRQKQALHHRAAAPYLDFVWSMVLFEPGVVELPFVLDGLLELPLVPLIDELPLLEPEVPGVVVLLDELGLVGSVVVDEELVEDGGVVVAEGVDVVLLVPDLFRSQPVTAAVATASTATRGMSLFMTSPFACVVGKAIPRGAELLCFRDRRMQDACQAACVSGSAAAARGANAVFSGGAGNHSAAWGEKATDPGARASPPKKS